MDSHNNSIGDARMKRLGTREEVFKGLAIRTAGGLKKDDIIAKQFGTKTLYISKRLSDRMRENFQNANYFRKRVRKTLVAANNTLLTNTLLTNTLLTNTLLTNTLVLGNTPVLVNTKKIINSIICLGNCFIHIIRLVVIFD
jgi:hypothetical protein